MSKGVAKERARLLVCSNHVLAVIAEAGMRDEEEAAWWGKMQII